MPTGVFDASLITQRARAKAESNSFINRIQNPVNPTTSYGPLTGIYDNSEVNRVKNGQMKYFQRNGACTVAYVGCPCTVLTPSGQVANNVIIVAPGPTTITNVEYGSVITTWQKPTGTEPFIYYTITARPLTGGGLTLTDNTTNLTYTYAQGVLTPGIEYEFKVTATNDGGTGGSANALTIYAPFPAPVIASPNGIVSSSVDPNLIFININQYLSFSPTNYIIKQYVNNSTTSTTITGSYSQTGLGGQITLGPSGLSAVNVYQFQVQLYSGNNYTSFTVKSTPPTGVYPNGPTITGVTNITSTTAQINYTNYTSGGFDLETGNAEAIITDGITTYTYSNLTNTSVIISGTTKLSPLTTYSTLTIKFQKTIQGNLIDSATSNIPAFTTNGIPPVVISSLAPTQNNATIEMENYLASEPGEFDFTSATVVVPGATPSYETITPPNQVYIGGLAGSTIYNGCTISLSGAGGEISDPSLLFQIITRTIPPQVNTVNPVTDTTATCLLDPYSGFPLPSSQTITVVKAYDASSGTPPYITEFSVSYTAGSSTFVITNLSPASSYDVVVTVSNGTYTSAYSSLFSFSTPAPPEPTISMQSTGMITWTTALLNFDFYQFSDSSPPTGAIVTSPTYGTISVVPGFVTNTSVPIQYLIPADPATYYNDLQLVLTNTSTNKQSPPVAVPPFYTNTSTGNFNTVGFDSSTETTGTYQVNTNFPWAPTASYVTGNLGSNPTQEFTSSLQPLFGNTYQITISGLSAGTTYNNIKIAVSDVANNNFSSLGDGGSFNTQPMTYAAPTMILITGSGPTRADVTGVYDNPTLTITFNYAQYTLFTPTSGELLDSSDNVLGSVVSVSDTQLVISGISPAYYQGYRIKLYGSAAVSNPTASFDFTAIPVLNAGQDPNPGSNPITIKYTDMNFNFGFNVTSGDLYVPGLSSFPYSSSVAFNDSAQFSPSGTGNYSNCYIVLFNTGNNTVTLPSNNVFDIEIQ
jgi:hypothetical protein